MDNSIFYSPNQMLSYNRILSFVIGARGIGKSFAFKRHPINRFLKHGEQFIYLRRYKTELKKIDTYFNDIAPFFPKNKFKTVGREFYVDDKLMGWAVPLSSWQSEKSNSYPNVSLIVYDEFIREKDNSGYLPNEVESLLNFMDTVFRNREDVRCIGLSNAVSVVNPYFLYFDLVPDITKRFNAYENIIIEIPNLEDFQNMRKETRFGKLINGTNYADMSLSNEFINDSNTFIEKRSSASKYVFTILYKGLPMGVWVDVSGGVLYISTDHDPSSKHKYVLTSEDLKENTMLITGWKSNYHLKKFVSAFKNGYLRFDNQVVRTLTYEILKKMNIH